MTKTIDALVEALEAYGVDEAAEIIKSLIDNINQRGMYSKESTVGFLEQAFFCLKPANQSKTAALAQARAEQAEPYGYVYEFEHVILGLHRSFSQARWNGLDPIRSMPVYTTPPAAPVAKLEPLTPEEINSLAGDHNAGGGAVLKVYPHAFARAIEAAHNAKLQTRAGATP